MSGTAEPTPAEQHLGDRLAALIDGELGHESRERVLAHLATCHSCKAEADAQRRVKSVFADTAPPGPSDGLLARLQGLPAGGDGGHPVADGSDSAGPEGPAESGIGLSYLGSGSVLTPQRGFRIHDPDRAAASRRAGRRFAFAAAGAFSLAAVAIGGALGGANPNGTSASPGGSPSASPLRTAATGVAGTERRGTERRGGDRLLTAQGGGSDSTAVGASPASATPPRLTSYGDSAIALAGTRTSLLDSAGAPPPLIRSAYPAGYAMTVAPPAVAPAPTPAPEPTPMAATPNR